MRVLEARGRLGGRMFSQELEGQDLIEFGANWVHGANLTNSLFNFAMEEGLLDPLIIDGPSLSLRSPCYSLFFLSQSLR